MTESAAWFSNVFHCAQLLSPSTLFRSLGLNSRTSCKSDTAKSGIKWRTDASVNWLSKRENDRSRRAKRFWYGKKTKGVKHQIVTDDIGCLLSVAVHKANLHDTKMGYWVAGLATFAYPTLEKICGDCGYRGSFVYDAYKYFGLRVEISKKLKPHVWQLLPKRWREPLFGSIILAVFPKETEIHSERKIFHMQ